MSDIAEIAGGVYWIGSKDPELRVFDDLYPTEHGTTYNSYLVRGEKTVVIDTVKGRFREEFLKKVRELVDPAEIDYYVVNHTEPDHSGSLEQMLALSPKATVISSQAARTFLGNLIHTPFASRVVKDGERLELGCGKTLRFIIAPFLHWPDTMFTLLEEERILFPCDAFGAHFCGDALFDDEVPDFTADARFYFDTIIRPFKDKVLAALDKLQGEEIRMICPSHGPLLRTGIGRYVERYAEWARVQPAGRKVVILYLSPHGNTATLAEAAARGAASAGAEVVLRHVTEATEGELQELMEQADALLFGIPTVNRDVPKPMWAVLSLLSTVRLKPPLVGIFGSYGWSGEACRLAEERVKGIGLKVPFPFVRASFRPRPEALEECTRLGAQLAEEVCAKLA